MRGKGVRGRDRLHRHRQRLRPRRGEAFLGEVLAGRPRDSYVLATKLYFHMPTAAPGLSPDQVYKQLDASLRRCGPTTSTSTSATATTEHAARRDDGGADRGGRARARCGTSDSPSGQRKRSAPRRRCRESSTSSRASRSTRSSGAARRRTCSSSREAGTPRSCGRRSPRASSQGSTCPASRSPGDARGAATRWGLPGGELDQRLLERVQKLRPIARGLGLSLPQLALAWVLRRAERRLGDRRRQSRPEQVEDNAGSLGRSSSTPTTLARIDEILGDSVAWEPPDSAR